MGLYDQYFNPSTMFGGNNARGDMDSGYDNANGYMNPYYQGGVNQWNKMGNYADQQGQMLGKYGNPMDWAWSHANMSPTDFYNGIMSQYQQSPQAKYATQQMENQTDHAASASGMVGSGAYGKALQSNANQISQNDMQQYFNNAMNSYKGQMAAGENFQGQQEQYERMMQWMAQMGMGAGGQMGNWSVGQGQGDAADDWKRQQGMNQMIGMAAGFF